MSLSENVPICPLSFLTNSVSTSLTMHLFYRCSDLAHRGIRNDYWNIDQFSWAFVEWAVCGIFDDITFGSLWFLGLAARHWWHFTFSPPIWSFLVVAGSLFQSHVIGIVVYSLWLYLAIFFRDSMLSRLLGMHTHSHCRVYCPSSPHPAWFKPWLHPHRLAIHPFDGLPVQGEQRTVLMLCCN